MSEEKKRTIYCKASSDEVKINSERKFFERKEIETRTAEILGANTSHLH